MIVQDLYKTLAVSQKVCIREIYILKMEAMFKTLYDGSIDGVNIELFDKNVLDIKTSIDKPNTIMITVN